MPERMFRAQILLEPRQLWKLEEIAHRENRSISAVTRQVIDAGFKSLENEAEIWVRRAQVLRELSAIRENQPFEYSGLFIGS